mmetsp:Transcript_3009/g.9957  ORF Transcript_3009/g.9957 Transcript_3009/m.9957 type:complete len:212 (+) Transcript_3009:535-1170(+)
MRLIKSYNERYVMRSVKRVSEKFASESERNAREKRRRRRRRRGQRRRPSCANESNEKNENASKRCADVESVNCRRRMIIFCALKMNCAWSMLKLSDAACARVVETDRRLAEARRATNADEAPVEARGQARLRVRTAEADRHPDVGAVVVILVVLHGDAVAILRARRIARAKAKAAALHVVDDDESRDLILETISARGDMTAIVILAVDDVR